MPELRNGGSRHCQLQYRYNLRVKQTSRERGDEFSVEEPDILQGRIHVYPGCVVGNCLEEPESSQHLCSAECVKIGRKISRRSFHVMKVLRWRELLSCQTVYDMASAWIPESMIVEEERG